jgi:hypothetical protein
MKCFYTEEPKGTFFAVYNDLSGAHLFTELEGGKFLNCAENYEIDDYYWFMDSGFLWFFNVDETYAKQAEKQNER